MRKKEIIKPLFWDPYNLKKNHHNLNYFTLPKIIFINKPICKNLMLLRDEFLMIPVAHKRRNKLYTYY